MRDFRKLDDWVCRLIIGLNLNKQIGLIFELKIVLDHECRAVY